MRDSLYEWDDQKAAKNCAAHGVTFEIATSVFRDPMGLDFLDTRQEYGEDRSIRIGMVDGVLLTVIYADRGERIRIISARRSTRQEQDEYFKQTS